MQLPKVGPVFIRASKIPDFKTLKNMNCVKQFVRKLQKKLSLLGVQKISMLRCIYLKSKGARASVISNKVDIKGHYVNVFTNNPTGA